MRLPFFGKADAPLTVPLPETVNIAYAVLFEASRHRLPERGDMVEMARLWLDRHAEGPLKDALKEYVDSPMTVMDLRSSAAIPLPDPSVLRAMGIGKEEERRLREATHGVMLFARDMLRHPRFGLHAARALAFGIASATNGVIFDPDTMKVVPLGAYDQPIPENGLPVMGDNIVVPASVGSNGLGLMTTAGMTKFGLPNLYLSDVPRELFNHLGSVVTGVAYHLTMIGMSRAQDTDKAPSSISVGPEVTIRRIDLLKGAGQEDSETPQGVRGWTTIRLAFRNGGQLGGRERFLEILPPRSVRSQRSVWHYSLLDDLIGSQDDVKLIKSGSEPMEIAHRKAMDELPAMKQRYMAGLRPGETFFIKKGFPMRSGDLEYMWVTVIGWKDTSLQGVLSSEPQSTPDLRAGQKLQVMENEIYDWILKVPDGAPLGNYTGRVLQREGLS